MSNQCLITFNTDDLGILINALHEYRKQHPSEELNEMIDSVESEMELWGN